jgi:hypothetical protein
MRVIGSYAFLRPVLVLVAVTLTACSAPTPTVPTASIAPLPTVVKITIAGLPTSVTYQESVQLTAMVTLADGAQKQTLDVAWQSSDPTVATVSRTGLLTLVGFGDADVTATFENLRASAHVAVSRPIVRYDISGVVHESAPTENVLLPGATVGIHFVGCPSCPHDNQTTTTDGSGRFTLHGIDTAGFTLWVSKPGYDAKSFEVVQLPRDQHPEVALTPLAGDVAFSISGSNAITDLSPYCGVPNASCDNRLITSFPVHHSGELVVRELINPMWGSPGVGVYKFSAAGLLISITGGGGPFRANLEGGYKYTLAFTGEFPMSSPFRVVLTRPR